MTALETTQDRETDLNEQARRQLEALCVFLREHGARHFYSQWPAEMLEALVYFHARQRTLAWVAERGVRSAECGVQGIGFATQLSECQVRKAVASGQTALLDWLPDFSGGNCLLLGHFACSNPQTFRAVMRALARRFPSWRSLKLFTFRWRHGQPVLHGISRRAIDRLLMKGAV